jgi:hypothetical protein
MNKIIPILIAIVVFSNMTNQAYACSCGGQPDFLLTWMSSSGAFQGTVKEIIRDNGPLKVIFDVHMIQKGISYNLGNYTLNDRSTIHNDDGFVSISSCGVDYNIGETYQVFEWSGQSPGICSTKQVSGYDEYSHENENGQVQNYREDYNYFTQYSFWSLIIPITMAVIIPLIIIIWRKRKNHE